MKKRIWWADSSWVSHEFFRRRRRTRKEEEKSSLLVAAEQGLDYYNSGMDGWLAGGKTLLLTC
jgi:hypothetical protein